MKPLIIITQIFIILAESARPSILQLGQGISFLTLRDQFEQAADKANTRIYSTKSQNATSTDRYPAQPFQSTNSTPNPSVGNGAKLTCNTTPLNSPDSCRQALSLLPLNRRTVSYGRFDQRDHVTHPLPYSLTSC